MGAVENIITDNLPIWSSAIQSKSSAGRGTSGKRNLYGVKKLRELILDLAVRGLLVPQDPNDEPASVLLEKIAAERTALVKSKEIRKQKVLGHVSAKEQFHPLPINWVAIRLNDVGDWGAGATPLRGRSELYGGSIPWFKSGELNTDYLFNSDETVTELALTESSLRLNNVGDVLVAMYGATIGKASILNIKATTNQAVCACRVYSGVSNTFLLTLLKAYRPRFIKMGVGGAQPNISREKIIATPINLPPIAEQHRIVAKVDELMALCDTLEQQQEDSIQAHETLVEVLLEALSNAVDADAFQAAWERISEHFDALFTTDHSINKLKETILQLAVMGKLVPQDPNDEPASVLLEKIAAERERLVKEGKIRGFKVIEHADENLTLIPKSWSWCSLGNILSVMNSGWSPACLEEPSNSIDVWGVLKTTSVQKMSFLNFENKTLPANKEPKPQYEVRPGDILITRAGPRNRVGISCLVKNTRPKLMISDKLIRFHLISDLISKNFISLCLNAGPSAIHIEKSKSGMADSQVNISQNQLKATPIPLPPSHEQHRIVAKVDELMALCDQLKSSLKQAQETQILLTDAVVENTL